MKEQAKALQQNPLIRTVLRDMRDTTVMQWRASQQPAEREAAWMFGRTIDSFESTLDTYINEIMKSGDAT
jgi:hypothetical protein